MLYYYFQSKEGLYLAALEEAYRRVRTTESELNLDDLDPESALRLCSALTPFWKAQGHFREGRDWLERAMRGAGTPDPVAGAARAVVLAHPESLQRQPRPRSRARDV